MNKTCFFEGLYLPLAGLLRIQGDTIGDKIYRCLSSGYSYILTDNAPCH